MPTPRLTQHARERCAEMEVSTKIAKRIVQHADLTRPGRPGSGLLLSVSDEHPAYVVVHTDPADGEPVEVVTVCFRTGAEYVRNGKGFILTGKD